MPSYIPTIRPPVFSPYIFLVFPSFPTSCVFRPISIHHCHVFILSYFLYSYIPSVFYTTFFLSVRPSGRHIKQVWTLDKIVVVVHVTSGVWWVTMLISANLFSISLVWHTQRDLMKFVYLSRIVLSWRHLCCAIWSVHHPRRRTDLLVCCGSRAGTQVRKHYWCPILIKTSKRILLVTNPNHNSYESTTGTQFYP